MFFPLCEVKLAFLQALAADSCWTLTLIKDTRVGSPGQVVGLVIAKLLSTTCVVQGMMGTSLLHTKINQKNESI